MRTTFSLLALVTLLLVNGVTIPAIAQEAQPKITLSPAQLASNAIHRRAIEAVVWGMPAVNYDRMYQAMVRDAKAGDGSNKIVYWSRLFGWKNQTLTPNPDTIYLMPFINTKDAGPMVLEIPPADEGTIVGSVDDCWQMAIEDVGPAGVDKGKGGKYLVLPPGYKGKVPAGYIPMPSPTYQSYALLRSNLKSGSDADVAKAVAYGKRVKLYPLSQAANPPATTFVDAMNVVYDATIPYDLRFFESLDRIVQAEPWLTRDKAMIDMLRTIGIERGKSFHPDAAMQATLKDAIGEARAWLDAQYEASYSNPLNPGTHWALPVSTELVKAVEKAYAVPDSYPVDVRGTAYSFAFFSTKHLGAGQYYLFTIHDNEGRALDGGTTYRLRVPANVPVRQYWSVTAYDRMTHALIRDTPWSSRSSQTPGLQKNADGSVDVYFGPKTPAGKEANWIPTRADGRFEGLFRFYGPEKALFDKTWKLPDIGKVQ